VAAASFRRKTRPINITTEDLGYQEHSPEELSSESLLDLNSASEAEFMHLGLDRETIDRIAENRPYRNKLDLLSRMVIPEQAYNLIRNQVGVAKATEFIKVAG
jgi:DNA uptake protein ComE-like DNA-binding protein